MNEQQRRWQAFVGYTVDAFRLVRGCPIVPHSYLKFRRLDALRSDLHADTLIESSTYLGNTAYRASFFFTSVFTIELDEALARRASRLLKRRRNVFLLEGDAIDVLPTIFSEHAFSKAVVFLDGHYSGGVTAHGAIAEPAIEEIRILARHRARIAAIVIDDFRCFGVDLGFPSKSQLLNAIETELPKAEITVAFDQVIVTPSPRNSTVVPP